MNDHGDESSGPGDEVGDDRRKHVKVVTRGGDHHEYGNVYLTYTTDTFVVSPERSFPADETTRYPKADLLRIEVNQHHSACFITTATAGEGPTVASLRGFRDDVLARSRVGRALVASYERLSPPIAGTLARHPRARFTRVVRWLVERCAALARRRRATDSALGRGALSVVLVALYVVGIALALASHIGLETRDALESTTPP
ncbi:MAG: hypothetical protein M8354_06470 [Halalkalicoccus sp.]|nr:hypothetical protein [Halalkalicoccus sp.]